MFRLPTYRRMIRLLQTLLAVVTMLGYLAANVELASLHELVHHEEIASHSAADEKDPCHRQLYHQDFTKGCAHKTHLVASKKCGLCDHHLSADKVFHTTDLITASSVVEGVHAINDDSVPSTTEVYIPARGPPTA